MRWRPFILTIFLFLGAAVNAQRPLDNLLAKFNTGKVSYTSVEQLKMNQIDQKVVVLDARELEEYKVSHLKGSYFTGYNEPDLSILDSINIDSQIVVYCSIGIRSEKIALKIQQLGFKKVFNLYGGIFEWKNSGYLVYDLQGKETQKVHAYSRHWSQYLLTGEKIY